MTDEIYAQRRHLTFAQAEGIEPLPTQLQLRHISEEMRAYIWEIIYVSMRKSTRRSSIDSSLWLTDPWKEIMYNHWLSADFKFVDDFIADSAEQIARVKIIIQNGSYADVLGFIQFVLRQEACPHGFGYHMNQALEESRSAYRIYNDDTVIPISVDQDGRSVLQAFSDLGELDFAAARTHLRSAGSTLTEGKFSDSIRESIHAVESVARVITSSNTLGDALIQLEKSQTIHPALKKGFTAIYGYTSDEKGIRHPLIDNVTPGVDETDALFMISACSAFLSYMIAKHRITT